MKIILVAVLKPNWDHFISKFFIRQFVLINFFIRLEGMIPHFVIFLKKWWISHSLILWMWCRSPLFGIIWVTLLKVKPGRAFNSPITRKCLGLILKILITKMLSIFLFYVWNFIFIVANFKMFVQVFKHIRIWWKSKLKLNIELQKKGQTFQTYQEIHFWVKFLSDLIWWFLLAINVFVFLSFFFIFFFFFWFYILSPTYTCFCFYFFCVRKREGLLPCCLSIVCLCVFVFVWDGMGRRGGEEGWVGGISYGLDVGLLLLEYPGFYDFYAFLWIAVFVCHGITLCLLYNVWLLWEVQGNKHGKTNKKKKPKKKTNPMLLFFF